MGAGYVMELGCAVLDPASGFAQVVGPRMLTQREEMDQVCLQPRHWYLAYVLCDSSEEAQYPRRDSSE